MRQLAVLATVAAALAAPALAHAAPPIQRPDPATYPVTLDYTNPLPGPDGGAATLSTLDQGVIVAATDDRQYLAYATIGDLGGFEPAPVGSIALSSGGHDVLLPGRHQAQIPLFSETAGGKISSFTFSGTNPLAGNQPPDNGNQPVPGPTGRPRRRRRRRVGTPSRLRTRASAAGRAAPRRPEPPPRPAPRRRRRRRDDHAAEAADDHDDHLGHDHDDGPPPARRRPPPPRRPPAWRWRRRRRRRGGGAGGCSGGSCAAGSCGVAGIEVEHDAAGCTIAHLERAPGDSISETWTITNTTGAPYLLSIKAEATPSNHLSTTSRWACGTRPGLRP